MSIGIARWTNDVPSATELLKNADAAMYRAKAAGKNCIRVADAESAIALESST